MALAFSGREYPSVSVKERHKVSALQTADTLIAKAGIDTGQDVLSLAARFDISIVRSFAPEQAGYTPSQDVLVISPDVLGNDMRREVAARIAEKILAGARWNAPSEPVIAAMKARLLVPREAFERACNILDGDLDELAEMFGVHPQDVQALTNDQIILNP